MDWDEMARPWLESASELEIAHKPVVDALMTAAALSTGEKVLDVGSGTGPSIIAAAHAIGPNGHITGIDISPPLLARAAERVPENVELIAADAGSYRFTETDFDVVISNFGIMFFEDNVAAFANLRKAIRPGGRLVATVWGPPSENPWFSTPRAILDEFIPDLPRPDPTGPGPMRFGDPLEMVTMLETAGWKPSVETLNFHLLPPGDAGQVAALHMKVTAGMMLRGVEVSNAMLVKVEEALVIAYRDLEENGQIRVPAQINVVTALRV